VVGVGVGVDRAFFDGILGDGALGSGVLESSDLIVRFLEIGELELIVFSLGLWFVKYQRDQENEM
jgi:hypothetical protein